MSDTTYADSTYADAYFTARNNADWSAASQTAKDASLVAATQYLDGAYSWIGTIKDITQVLGWPRVNAVVVRGNFAGQTEFEIPIRVQNACCELALAALSGDLLPADAQAIESAKVGPIAVTYDNPHAAPSYPVVDNLLDGLMWARDRLVRA